MDKNEELDALNCFNDFYSEICDDYFEILESTERPDFICKRNDGSIVGVELVSIRRGHPEQVFFDKTINKNVNMLPAQALELIQELIYIKEKKRISKDWKCSDRMILIVQLMESPLWEMKGFLKKEYFPDLVDFGFLEIWLADFSEFEAYKNIELFCLYPFSKFGYFSRGFQKPFS